MSRKRKRRRSGTESCQICGCLRPLVEHHIHGRDIQDAEKAWNKCWICPNCHDDIHIDPPRIIVEGWFRGMDGLELIWRRQDDEPIICDGAKPNGY